MMEAVFEFIRSLLPNVDFGILAGADILNLTSVNNIKAFHLVIRILSWAALAVSLLSFIFLRWLASRRGTKEDLSVNIISAVVAVILTSRTGQLHWWVIVSPCLSIYVLMYPFRYLRVYFKKLMMVVYIGLCILFAGNYAISTLQVYLPKFKLIALAMWLVACGASVFYVWLHSSGHKCPKCRRYIAPVKIGERTDKMKKYTDTKHHTRVVREEDVRNFRGDVVGKKQYVENLGKSVYDVTERDYTEIIECPVCGFVHQRRGSSIEREEHKDAPPHRMN